MMSAKDFSGLLNHTITEAGDDLQEVRLLEPDPVTKTWKFVE